MNTKKILVLIIAFFVLMISAAIIVYQANKSRANLPAYGSVDHFDLTERSGQSISVETLKGKISVINFFFANCTGPCPAMNAKVADMYRQYVGAPQVQFISITIDPDRDSLEALQKYAKIFNVDDNRWLFGRTSSEEVQNLSEKIFMVGGGAPTTHSTKLILVDDKAQIRGFYSSEENASLTVLKAHIRELVKNIGR